MQDADARLFSGGRLFLGFGAHGSKNCLGALAKENGREVKIIATHKPANDDQSERLFLFELVRPGALHQVKRPPQHARR